MLDIIELIIDDEDAIGVEAISLVEHPAIEEDFIACLLYTSPSPRDRQKSRMPSSA